MPMIVMEVVSMCICGKLSHKSKIMPLMKYFLHYSLSFLQKLFFPYKLLGMQRSFSPQIRFYRRFSGKYVFLFALFFLPLFFREHENKRHRDHILQYSSTHDSLLYSIAVIAIIFNTYLQELLVLYREEYNIVSHLASFASEENISM